MSKNNKSGGIGFLILLFCLFLIFIIIALPRAIRIEEQKMINEIPLEYRGVALYYTYPDLSDFVEADEYGLEWDCRDSSWKIDEFDVQIITLKGPYLRFFCTPDGVVMVDFAEVDEVGVDAGPGNHDYFIKK